MRIRSETGEMEMRMEPGELSIKRRFVTARARVWLIWAGVALAFALGAGCFGDANSNPPVYGPVDLLERGGGSTKITIYPNTATFVGDGIVQYEGSARADIAGDAEAGRSAVTLEGTAQATVNENTNERDFTFTSNSSSDLGWSGVDATQVSISGSGPFSSGLATLSSAATINPERQAAWGFSTSVVNIAANLAVDQPIYTTYADTGSVGNPISIVGGPNPGGVGLNSNAMAVIFAPVSGDSAVGPVSAGRWVKFVLAGSVPLQDGVLLAWNPGDGTLRGSGTAGYLTTPGGSVAATVELTASVSASYLSFVGALDPPQLGVLTEGRGILWTDATCSDCGDLTFSGGGVTVGTLNIPSLTATQQIRNGSPTSSIIRATNVTGSIGPVTIDTANLTVDMSDMSNLLADLDVSGRVLGIPITTTFRGPFTFDLTQMSVTLTGDLYLNLNGQVVLDGDLQATLAASGVTVNYVGGVSLPGYGASFNVNGNVSYDIALQSLNLSVQASGNVGPISVNGIGFTLNLVPDDNPGIRVNGSLTVASVSSGTASLTNLKVSFTGNTSTGINATINSSSDRVRFKVGTFADVTAYGSASYTVSTNTLRFNLNYGGRVGSWQISGGTLTLSWPGSGSVTGSITAGRISNGQATISNAVVDFTASTSSVTATLRPTTLTVGSMVSATVQGNASYNSSSNTLTLSLQASGRVGSWNVSGVQASVTWPGSGNITGNVSVGQISNGQVTLSNAVIDFTASSTSVTATLRPTTLTASTLVSATVQGSATYNTSTSTLSLQLTASGRVGPVNVSGVQASVTWPLSGNITGNVSVGNISYGPASLNSTTISFNASSTVVNASISSTLNVGDPFRLTVGLSGSATYNVSTNILNVSITTGAGTMWGKPITGTVTFNVNVSSSTISGSASTSSLKFSYDKFAITLTSTSINFSVSGGAVSVSGSGNVAVTGPMGNGWLSGSGSFTISGAQLRSTSYRITLNNVNKTIIWVDVGPRNGAPLTVDIIAGQLSYDAEGKMQARVDTGFPFYCEDLEFKIHAWGDQNVLRVDFEGSWVIGLFGAAGHVDVYDWLTSTNPPMYGYADVRITFFWFRYQTWNGQSIDNGGC